MSSLSQGNRIMNKVLKGLKWFAKSFLWVIPLLLVIDIVSKQVAQAMLVKGTDVVAIPGLINFYLTYNNGAAFSLFGNLEDLPRRIILISVSILGAALMIGLLAWKYKKLDWWYKSALFMMIAGDIGNFIDRAFYKDGLVIDFIKFSFWKNFAIFNLADSFLVVGVFILIVAIIVEEVKETAKVKKISSEDNKGEEDENSNSK